MDMDTTFYNSNGKPTAYTQDGEHIFLFSGKPVAYINNLSVIGYNGKHLGTFDDGWVRDNQGFCVFFTNEAIGGPFKPIKKIKPIKSVKRVKSIKAIKQVKPVRPVKKLSWSRNSNIDFFES